MKYCHGTQHQGCSYVYEKTHLRTHLDQKYVKILSQFWWILDVMCTKCVGRTNLLISLNPILTEFVMMLVSPPHRHRHQLMQSEWGPWSYTFFIIYHYQESVHLGKQCRPWWDVTFCDVSSGSTLFVWYVPFSHAFSLFHKCVHWNLDQLHPWTYSSLFVFSYADTDIVIPIKKNKKNFWSLKVKSAITDSITSEYFWKNSLCHFENNFIFIQQFSGCVPYNLVTLSYKLAYFCLSERIYGPRLKEDIICSLWSGLLPVCLSC